MTNSSRRSHHKSTLCLLFKGVHTLVLVWFLSFTSFSQSITENFFHFLKPLLKVLGSWTVSSPEYMQYMQNVHTASRP